ncbi:PREDICTED: multifunctional protein ADE2-like, partial [Papilio polytes]|uniref:multifunctional protein ADE2-like n=1 Tax=Papilio polytes TaxID=76194 RepID=UPI000675CAED
MSYPKEVGGLKLGSLLIEGKTKQVFDLPEQPGHCLLLNKDRITAGDGVKAHDLEGKAAISNQTNAKVFEILKTANIKTAFVKIASPTAFISKKCDMVPIEWVTRRLATVKVNDVVIGQDEVDYMKKVTVLVFEILEKAWALRDCALIDMKIEFGVDTEGNILVADVIDSDSWRLWPSGDKRLMVDKQVYRDLKNVTAADLDTVKRNFAWVKDQLDHL